MSSTLSIFPGLSHFSAEGVISGDNPLIEYSVLRKGARPVKEEERRYEEAARVLPGRLREQALAQPPEVRQLAEEFRLRAGRPLVVLLPEGSGPWGPP